MGRLSSVGRLPAEVRDEIEQRMRDSGFSEYLQMETDLRGRGYAKISKSALGRYGLAMKKREQMARAAAEIRAAGVDPEITAELCGDACLVVVVDRGYGRARLVSVAAPAAAVIATLKRIGRVS